MYPIGISGELLCFYAAQNYAANVDSWSANVYGLQLTYRHFLIASMLVYVPSKFFFKKKTILIVFGSRNNIYFGKKLTLILIKIVSD